jgi:hypothetical protein
MRALWLLLGGCILVGCDRHDFSPAAPKSVGRYAGIGTFDAGRLWQQIKGSTVSQDKSAAGLGDDEHVIVALDTHTGEIRQCGDHSGFCVSMNPWTSAAKTTVTPVSLAHNANDLAAKDQSANSERVKN